VHEAFSLIKTLNTLALISALASCITPNTREWPDDVPKISFFVNAYRADMANQALQSEQAYLEWILGFYQGTVIYPTGWLDVERQLLISTGTEQKAVLASRLRDLGIRIGTEWAKDNEVRMIDNRMLALWGSCLQLMQGTDARLAAIDLVAQDIEALFKGALQKTDIVEARYAERLGFEVFGNF
tara:strand:- start:3596 stop:4147 length:552 start_codon:yes stop_codon:yes gene_type:complete